MSKEKWPLQQNFLGVHRSFVGRNLSKVGMDIVVVIVDVGGVVVVAGGVVVVVGGGAAAGIDTLGVASEQSEHGSSVSDVARSRGSIAHGRSTGKLQKLLAIVDRVVVVVVVVVVSIFVASPAAVQARNSAGSLL